jgi:catechol-2,3-dioxygenase
MGFGRLAALAAIAAMAVATVAGANGAAAQGTPDALKPNRIYGAGINVVDLEKQRAWYEANLGMKLANTLSRDGKPFEYIMSLGADSNVVMALLKTERPAGANGFSRVILMAPDSKALAQRLAAQGTPAREVAPGAWFITDPEGNNIELLTLSGR